MFFFFLIFGAENEKNSQEKKIRQIKLNKRRNEEKWYVIKKKAGVSKPHSFIRVYRAIQRRKEKKGPRGEEIHLMLETTNAILRFEFFLCTTQSTVLTFISSGDCMMTISI